MESPLLSVSAVHNFCLFPCHCLLLNSDLLLTSTQSAPSPARHTGRVLHCSTKEEQLSLILQIRKSYDAFSPLLSIDTVIVKSLPSSQHSSQRFSVTQQPLGHSLTSHSLTPLSSGIERQDVLHRPNNPLHHRLLPC